MAITAQASATKKQTSQASAEYQINEGIYNYIQQLGQAQNTRLDCFAPSKNLTDAMKATGTSGLTDWIKLYGANNAQALYESLKVLELKDAQAIYTGFANLNQKIKELQEQENDEIASQISLDSAASSVKSAASSSSMSSANKKQAVKQEQPKKQLSQTEQNKMALSDKDLAIFIKQQQCKAQKTDTKQTTQAQGEQQCGGFGGHHDLGKIHGHGFRHCHKPRFLVNHCGQIKLLSHAGHRPHGHHKGGHHGQRHCHKPC